MNEIETKLNELKKVLKPFNILSYIALGIVIIGAVFLILGVAIRNNITIDRLFAVGIGLLSSGVVFALSIVLIERKQYDEYYRLKKEFKKLKK